MHRNYKYIFVILALAFIAEASMYAHFTYGRGEVEYVSLPQVASGSIVLPPVEASVSQPNPPSTLFVGDVMLDRGVALYAKKFGRDALFKGVEELFQSADAVVANLEGTLTTNTSIAQKNNAILRFTFDPAYTALLKSVGFTAVSLANNHALDFGVDGYTQTVQNLTSAGIVSFGSPRNDRNLSNSLELQGQKVCFVGYHDLYTHDPKPVVTEIEAIKDSCAHVVVFVHWGEEYQPRENPRQVLLAHMFIDAGADLIIGAHPHVVQPIEIYNSKAIFYSLGNFMFDQSFSFATMHGLAVRVEWGSDATHFTLTPVAIKNGQVSVALLKDRDTVLKSLLGGQGADDIKTSILNEQTFSLVI